MVGERGLLRREALLYFVMDCLLPLTPANQSPQRDAQVPSHGRTEVQTRAAGFPMFPVNAEDAFFLFADCSDKTFGESTVAASTQSQFPFTNSNVQDTNRYERLSSRMSRTRPFRFVPAGTISQEYHHC